MWKEPLANHNPRLRNFDFCCWSWLEQGKSTPRLKLAVIRASSSVFLRGPVEKSRQRRSHCSEDSLSCLGRPRFPPRLAALPAETAPRGALGLGG